jgi:predicted permease
MDVLTDIRAIPGVSSAAYISGLPVAMSGGIWNVVPEGQASPEKRPRTASSRFITPGFFAALDIPIKRGRDVTDADTRDQTYVAVVSESFVQRYWPNEDPIGKRFKFLSDTRTIVGVVGDVRVRGPERTSEPQVYQSAQQVADGQSSFYYPKDLVVRSSIPASVLVPAIRAIVRRVDPQQPVSNIRMLADVVGEATAARAVQVRVLTAFAVIAFLLAGIGIHGLLSYAVSSRQHEIGVRMALGAQRNEIVRMIVRGGLLLAAAGVVPGLALAYVAARAMQSLLAGVEPGDIATFGAATVLCVAMTLVGSLLPTIRAIRVDPATALRAET